ncbi:hypothetical protein NDU88_003503 [Pleurodeles waltl]|uniref:Uncharacterized protein n=1 Tax=Pleurodeles waltl TaxID=8319 RepID=A0AAV7WT76_PLEWA|nr:hypothetical protein NDU88_003503 [Pleurodeles waltl]
MWGTQCNTESPRRSRQHLQKHLNRRSEDLSMTVDSAQQEGPTTSESNSASWAMQVRVLGTWARLCMKEVLQKCTEGRAAAVQALHRITIWCGEARTYLHQISTEGLLDCRGYLDPAPVFQGPRSSRCVGTQRTGDAEVWCLHWQGKIPSTHRRFILGFQCRVKADSPQSMHHQETVEKACRMRRYNVAGILLATLLRFCRCPGAVSDRSLAEVEEGSAEELW